jgi:L-ascorbate metabolism protein UlaG (beta-lactamase superfamily)
MNEKWPHTLKSVQMLKLFIFMAVWMPLGYYSVPTYPVSDHYDGSYFFNPYGSKTNGLWNTLKLLPSLSFEKWPDFIENAPSALDLNHPLGLNEAAITFVNHATVLIQIKGFHFLTDPVWSERVSPYGWIGPKRHRLPGIAFEKLPKIDFVLISHNHYDHLDLATLKRLNTAFAPCFIVPLGNKQLLTDNGITHVQELDWWQDWVVDSHLKVSLAPAQHASARGLFDKDKTLWGSYFITFNHHRLYFAGDTAYAPHFKAIFDHFGPPDIAFLPIGAYEPRWFMKVVHMNPEEAVKAHLDLGSRQSIGIHFGTFQLTNEAINQPVKDLKLALKNKNVTQSEFITLNEGQTRIFELQGP